MTTATQANVESLVRDLRRWKALASIFLAALIGVGLFSAYLLRQLDHDYALLIDRTLPLLDQIRALGREDSNAFRAIVSGLVENDPRVVAKAVADIRQDMERVRYMETVLAASDILRENPALLTEMRSANEAYITIALELLPRITPEATAESERARLAQVRVSLERAIAVNRAMMQFVEARSQAISDDYTRVTRSRSAILLGIAGLPLVFVLIAVAFIVVVIFAMILVFRRVGVDEAV